MVIGEAQLNDIISWQITYPYATELLSTSFGGILWRMWQAVIRWQWFDLLNFEKVAEMKIQSWYHGVVMFF